MLQLLRSCKVTKCSPLMDTFGYHALNYHCGGEMFCRHESVCRAFLILAQSPGLKPVHNARVKFSGLNSDILFWRRQILRMRSIASIATKCLISQESISSVFHITWSALSVFLLNYCMVNLQFLCHLEYSEETRCYPHLLLLFCLILQPLLEVIAEISDINVFEYLDDTYIFVPLAQVECALSYLDIEGPASGFIPSSETKL